MAKKQRRRQITTRRFTGVPDQRTIPTTVRVCLRCQAEFASKGPGNRICERCNRHNLESVQLPRRAETLDHRSKRLGANND